MDECSVDIIVTLVVLMSLIPFFFHVISGRGNPLALHVKEMSSPCCLMKLKLVVLTNRAWTDEEREGK